MIKTTTPKTPSIRYFTIRSAQLIALAFALLAAPLAFAGTPTLPFSKAFAPDTIGPNSTSMLVFTIDNSNGSEPADTMAFDDELPFGVSLATPAFVSNDCGGTVTIDDDDADSAFDIRLVNGGIGAGASCEIVVNVTSAAPSEGPYTNISGALTSSVGTSGPATAGLTVTNSLPGFTKRFEGEDGPIVALGGRATLIFTIDNSNNGSSVTSLRFIDTMPAGMVVADPANVTVSTECLSATVTAVPGTDVISAFDFSVDEGDTCTISVDVIGGAIGFLGNVTGDLFSSTVSIGKAAAVLEVTGVEALLELSKEFTDDPVPPGGTTTLEFTVTNKSRGDVATAITFQDNLEATLTGLVPAAMQPPDICGAGSSLSYDMGVLTLTGGTLAPEASCTFGVELAVPVTAAAGSYPNTAGPVSGDVGGEARTGNVADDILFVVPYPILTKEFTDDPVGAGDSVTLEFTITNTDPSSTLSGITFFDELTDNSGGLGTASIGNGFLPFPVSVTLPPVPDPPCGGGSSLALVSSGTELQSLKLTGGSLAEAGMVGDSCSFSVTLDIPDGFPAGTYTNTTEEISATLDGHAGTPTVVGPPATDDIEIAGAPQLIKQFVDDPVLPDGGPVTLEFTLRYSENALSDATAIAFSDDLTALTPAVPGLVATSVDTNTCPGSTVDIITAPTIIDFSGGSLAPGEECTVTLTLTVPAASPIGFHNNETSNLTATVGGIAVTGNPAADDLLITPLLFTKDFSNDPTIAGDEVDLVFRIENLSPTQTASAVSFSDNLSTILAETPDVTVVPPLPTLPASCGASASLTSVSPAFLSFSSGELAPGAVCAFTVTLMVPPGVADDDYFNLTSALSSSLGTLPAASDVLSVNSTLIELSKEFTDDPVKPGDTVTLEFMLENLSVTKAVTDIAFSDNLDAALSGLEASGASFNDCGPNTSMAGFPTGFFAYSGGSLAPGATCTIRLTVDVPDAPLPSAPPYINTSSAVVGKVGALDVSGAAASDELEINTLILSKAFDAPTGPGGTAVLTFTVQNLSATETAADLAFIDNLGNVIPGLAATTLAPNPVCGGNLSGTAVLSLTGATLAPDETCTFDVTVSVPPAASAGSFINTTTELRQASVPVADPAVALLTIVPAPTFAKAFQPDTITAGGVSTLTFTINNTASSVAVSDFNFVDNLPAGMTIASPANASTTCSGGMGDATAGATAFSFVGGSVALGAACTIQFDVSSNTVGGLVNTTGDLTSSSGNSGTASDTLTVQPLPPTFTKVFTPDTIAVNAVTTLTFTINNSVSLNPATNLAFTDILPPGVIVATPSGQTKTCSGGMVTAVAGSGVVSYAGGSVAAAASCTLSVKVKGTAAGMFGNTTGDLTSSAGNSGTASDTLTVDDDFDNDGIPNAMDNCPFIANPDQKDFPDGDGIGDVCDPDDDNDFITDVYELANGLNPRNSWDGRFGSMNNLDGDPFTNYQEFLFGSRANVADTDNNNNGVPDAIDKRRATIPAINYLLLNQETL